MTEGFVFVSIIKHIMRGIARNILFYTFSLFLLSQTLSGVRVAGGYTTYLIGGVVLSLMFLVLKPILSIVTFPLNFLTLGLFSFVVNAILLYLLTVFVPKISINAFTFEGISIAGFVIPKFYLNPVFAFVASSLLLSLILGALSWLIKK